MTNFSMLQIWIGNSQFPSYNLETKYLLYTDVCLVVAIVMIDHHHLQKCL